MHVYVCDAKRVHEFEREKRCMGGVWKEKSESRNDIIIGKYQKIKTHMEFILKNPHGILLL